MLKTVVATLLAASALVPAIALAQDNNGDHRGGRGDRGARAERPQAPRPDMGVRPQRAEGRPDVARGNWNRPQPARQQAPARIEAQPQSPQQQVQRRDFRQERQADRQAFRSERRDDRQALQNGEVTRPAFRADRQQDRAAFRSDRRDDRQQFQNDRRPDQQDARRVWQQRQQQAQGGWGRGGNRFDSRNWANNGGNRGNWNRGWRQDNRYDWNRYRTSNRGAFHLPRYYAPYGWDYGYRRFSIGFRLSPILFGQSYWIDDPYNYRLPEAYGPYRWVRYYNDALLVDLETGEVVDVIYDIFW